MKLQPKSLPAFARGSLICWDPRARLEKDNRGGTHVPGGCIDSIGGYSNTLSVHICVHNTFDACLNEKRSCTYLVRSCKSFQLSASRFAVFLLIIEIWHGGAPD